MKKSKAMAIILIAVLAIVFTSCAGSKKAVKENATLASDLEAARSRISDLEGQVKTKDQTIQDLEMHVAAKNDEISDLEGQLAMSEQEARDLEIQIVSREEEIAALEESMSTLQVGGEEETEAIDRLKNRRIALESEVDSLREQLAEANGRNEDLEAKIENLEKEISSLEAAQDRDRTRMSMTRDELIASLEREIEEKTIEIQQYKDALTINIVDQLFFDSGKAQIKKEGLDVLDRIAKALKGYDDKVIRIEGHTDDVPIGAKIRGKYPSNWELGAARSSAVVRYFIDEHGIDPSQMIAVSYSKYRPIVSNVTEEQRSRNRRIEIVLTQRAMYELMEIEESSVVME